MLRELECSGILDLFFICAKSQVLQVSQPAVNCLVLIWQWYLRRSPTASFFPINQTSCAFLVEEPVPTAVGAAATAVGSGEEEDGDVRAVNPRALRKAMQPSPRAPPVRAPSPQVALAAVRVERAVPRPSSSLASGPSGCSAGASQDAPPARFSPLLAFAKPRASSARGSAQLAAPAVTPVGGGQFVPQHNHDRFSASSSYCSSLAPEPLTTAESLTASSSDPDAIGGEDPSKNILDSNQNTAGKASRQLTESSSSAASMYQQAHRHSMSNPDSCHGVSSTCSPSQSRSSTEVNAAPIMPDQLAGQFSKMRIDVSRSSSSASGVPRAKQSGALDHALPQGTCSRPNQASALPAVRVAARPLKPQRQTEPSQQHTQSCLETQPEGGHWQSLPPSHPQPCVKGKGEGLERESPAESPSTPEHRKPTQRVLHFSPAPVVQSKAESFHSSSQGGFPTRPYAISTLLCLMAPVCYLRACTPKDCYLRDRRRSGSIVPIAACRKCSRSASCLSSQI